MQKVTKLHEILAVEGDLDATARRVMDETTNTFNKKAEHFQESVRTLEMFEENRSQENDVEVKTLVDTVAGKLSYVRGHLVRYYNTFAQKEATNQLSQADLVVDGVTLLTDAPATMLLGLESKLKTLRGMYEAIPTLQPGVDWELDPERGPDIYKAQEPTTRMRTEKTLQHKILVEATEHHPAQAEKWSADVPIGKITLREWSSMISPAEKSALLGRIDNLIRGVKKARQRANATEVANLHIGDVLFNYIHPA